MKRFNDQLGKERAPIRPETIPLIHPRIKKIARNLLLGITPILITDLLFSFVIGRDLHFSSYQDERDYIKKNLIYANEIQNPLERNLSSAFNYAIIIPAIEIDYWRDQLP
jgi:hypothetical protein